MAHVWMPDRVAAAVQQAANLVAALCADECGGIGFKGRRVLLDLFEPQLASAQVAA